MSDLVQSAFIRYFYGLDRKGDKTTLHCNGYFAVTRIMAEFSIHLEMRILPTDCFYDLFCFISKLILLLNAVLDMTGRCF